MKGWCVSQEEGEKTESLAQLNGVAELSYFNEGDEGNRRSQAKKYQGPH